MHQVGLQELLAAGSFSGTLPERVVLFGLQPETVDWGVELTPTVEAALDGLVESASRFVSQSLENS
jgi:hydrogenase maturation protease